MIYKDFVVLDLKTVDVELLDKIGCDSSGWRIFYSDMIDNYILFYPFSEYHGGGEPYLINIDNNDFEEWLSNNPDFESVVREIIVENK